MSTSSVPSISWSQAQPYATSQQPSVPAASASSESDPMMEELLKNINSPLDPELLKAAITPIAGSRTTQVPSSLQRPIGSFSPAPLDYRQAVGRGNANAQGIQNAITGGLNALGAILKHERQAKQDQVRDAATKVITSQQTIDQAQQQYAVAKASGDTQGMEDAQKIIDQNTKVRDGIFADPKMRKALQKGFQIDYVDPTKNKTEEHAGVMEAIKNAKSAQEKKQLIQAYRQKQNAAAGAAVGAAYAKQQPQTMVPNTQAQAKLQLELQNRAAIQQVMKDYLTYKGAMARAGATVDAAQVRGMYELQRQLLTNQQKQLDTQTNFDNKMKYLDAATAARMKLMWQGLVIANQKELDRLKINARDPLAVTKMADASEREWTAQVASAQGRLNAITNQLQTLTNPDQIAQLQKEADATRVVLQQAQNKQAYWDGIMATYKKMAGLPDEPIAGEGGDTSGSGDSSSSDSNANSIKSYTGDPTNIINSINQGIANYNLPPS